MAGAGGSGDSHRMRRSRTTWVELIREQKASGISDEEYAKRRGISVRRFRWWVWKLRREAERAPMLLPVRVIASTALSARRTGGGVAEVEADFPDGVRIRFSDGTSSERVVEVISGLRRC
jgi:hypothetical protein